VTDPAIDLPAPAGDPDFPVEWLDARDPDLTWEWDDMHMPGALTPLAADYVRSLAAGFAYGYRRLGLPIEIKVRVWNGYAYFAGDVDAPDEEHAAVWELRAERARAQIPLTDAYWREQALPELGELYRWIEDRPVDTMATAELATTWETVWRHVERAWAIHFYAIRGPYQVMDDLADLYEKVVPDATPGEALTLIGGGINELQDVERDLETLTALAAASPELAAVVTAPGATIVALDPLPGAEPFRVAFDAFLERHGHLGQSFDELGMASWSEEPDLLLAELAKRVEHPPEVGVEERRARLAAHAEALADGARARLLEDPERLAAFEAVLADARLIGPLTETHNYWIDRMAQARLRTFVMRVAGRLAAAGVLEAPSDILYLTRAEVPGLLRRPHDRRDLVAERRAEHARQMTVRPPRHLGKPPTPPSAGDVADRFDGGRFEATGPDELRGTGASAGVVRGTARVVLDQDGFAAVRAGDIIVCASSNPSWVPLFAIAGGLVTNTGGVLSHAAVVAREFALPAVVGTGDATGRIADGRQVELDGSSGIVRLL
jgi:phosphohistidine swiveling domain-containing protein